MVLLNDKLYVMMILSEEDSMPTVQNIKEKGTVLVPVKDWERMQKELSRLRKRVKKAQILEELRSAIIDIEKDIDEGRKPKGRDAREFIEELRNETQSPR